MSKAFVGDVPIDELVGKYILLRVDFNVPLTQTSKGQLVSNDARIKSALPTIRYLQSNDAKVIICSHLGRPKGGHDETLSLGPVALRLSELLDGEKVIFSSNCIGADVQLQIKKMQPRELLLLENLRFHAEEEANDPEFSRELAKGIDIYVNDAFGAAHRAHASTVGVTQFVPHSYCGFLMRDELLYLGQALDRPHRPVAAVVGGAKVSSKIEVLLNLIPKVDKILIGGGMVYTFHEAMGSSVGSALVERDCLKVASDIVCLARQLKVKVVLAPDSLISPVTIMVHPRRALASSVPATQQSGSSQSASTIGGQVPQNVGINEDAPLSQQNAGEQKGHKGHGEEKCTFPHHVAFADSADDLESVAQNACRVATNDHIPDGWTGVDIGPGTVRLFEDELKDCRTVLCNGPMGIFENPLYSAGTVAVLTAISNLTKTGVVTVVCGGDTLAAVESAGLDHNKKSFSHISTGGGAALEYLQGNILPGVHALEDADGVAHKGRQASSELQKEQAVTARQQELPTSERETPGLLENSKSEGGAEDSTEGSVQLLADSASVDDGERAFKCALQTASSANCAEELME